DILYAGYDFTGGSISNSKLFATNSMDFALSAKWSLSDSTVFAPLTVNLADKGVIEGLRLGLEGVKEGEECYILFSGKLAFGKEKNGTIPANSPLAFRVWVQNVEN
ncbi:MAG: FKBP-type peptidyl-prolyl cis-trans isomerase, partial [Bacteroidia bacterium]|nr:FKBP-type peptidyl-prolyl cis-trans isomerase [Bacteroidia bacterium]